MSVMSSSDRSLATVGLQPRPSMISAANDNRSLLNLVATPTLRPTQVAKILGISVSSIYKMIHQGTLTTVHLGGLKSTRVLTTDLLAFLKIDPTTLNKSPAQDPSSR